MALISKPYTFTVGTVIVASEHNNNFDTLYNDYNGGITNANISSGAAIADTKLAQITTASKISGAALTSLSSIPSGAGQIPGVNVNKVSDADEDTQIRVEQSANENKIRFYTAGTQRALMDSTGMQIFVSGTGTPAANVVVLESPIKGWATFNGTTGLMQYGYNVSTVGKNATGDYTINWKRSFTTANYVCVGNASNTKKVISFNTYATGSVKVSCFDTNDGAQGAADDSPITVMAIGIQ